VQTQSRRCTPTSRRCIESLNVGFWRPAARRRTVRECDRPAIRNRPGRERHRPSLRAYGSFDLETVRVLDDARPPDEVAARPRSARQPSICEPPANRTGAPLGVRSHRKTIKNARRAPPVGIMQVLDNGDSPRSNTRVQRLLEAENSLPERKSLEIQWIDRGDATLTLKLATSTLRTATSTWRSPTSTLGTATVTWNVATSSGAICIVRRCDYRTVSCKYRTVVLHVRHSESFQSRLSTPLVRKRRGPAFAPADPGEPHRTGREGRSNSKAIETSCRDRLRNRTQGFVRILDEAA